VPPPAERRGLMERLNTLLTSALILQMGIKYFSGWARLRCLALSQIVPKKR